MKPDGALSAAGRIARTHDPDRFLTALFAPPGRREALLVLIAFNHELVRALETPSLRVGATPIAALIRLQWWREVVEGQSRRHEIAEPLVGLLDAGLVARETLLSLIEAREQEVEGTATMADWQAQQLGGAGGLQVALAEALGEGRPAALQAVRRIGAAYAAGAIVRNHRAIVRAGRCPLPDELLFDAGSSRDGLLAAHDPRLAPAVLEPLREAGRCWLVEAGLVEAGRHGAQWRRPGRDRIAAWLPAVLARSDLAGGSPGARGLGDRLALTAAWLRGAP